MSIYSFTEEEIEKLRSEHAKIKKEYEDLLEKGISDIWLDECNEFKKYYNKMIKVNP